MDTQHMPIVCLIDHSKAMANLSNWIKHGMKHVLSDQTSQNNLQTRTDSKQNKHACLCLLENVLSLCNGIREDSLNEWCPHECQFSELLEEEL